MTESVRIGAAPLVNEFSPFASPTGSQSPSARKTDRDSMFLAVAIERLGGGRSFTARARNVSTGGLMADDLDGLQVGDRVALAMRGIDRVEGQVAWVRDGQVGIAFDEPIDPRRTRRPIIAPTSAVTPKRALFPKRDA